MYRLRTEIRHKYAYHFQASERSGKHHSGLDFTKLVIVTNQEFINEGIVVVDQDEYKEIIYNIGKIVDSVIKFVDDYVEHIKGIKRLHEREFERRYHFSSLKYFKRELGLSQKKEPEEEDMLRDNVKKYYLEQDYNCAETILRCIDEEYGIGLTEDDFKLVSAFGGGMGCGSSCGALCGAMAALGCGRLPRPAGPRRAVGDAVAGAGVGDDRPQARHADHDRAGVRAPPLAAQPVPGAGDHRLARGRS